MVRIGLLGDIMLGRRVGEALLSGVEAAELWDPQLRELARSLDLVICNLECCLSVRGAPTTLIADKPYFFPRAAAGGRGARGDRRRRRGTRQQPPAGLRRGCRRGHGGAAGGARHRDRGRRDGCRRGASAGGRRAGRDTHRRARTRRSPGPYTATAERFGIAYARLRDGVPSWFLDDIAELRQRCEVVVVFVHWGANMTTRPAAWQRAAAAALSRRRRRSTRRPLGVRLPRRRL
jgi:Bacterial capsule synthesis protein PGA_cap